MKTKKTVSKAKGKPAAKRKPLIEGKYSHKFLTRLEPDIGERLEALKKDLGVKTYNGVIKHLVYQFSTLIKDRNDLRTHIDRLTHQHSELKGTVRFFNQALAELQKHK
jgi:hypothetical protein